MALPPMAPTKQRTTSNVLPPPSPSFPHCDSWIQKYESNNINIIQKH
ncbi:hypothetical protein SOVF_092140 [Spinacia oleracea]|nr:hypothetical protein SOVF_092140 [Spinacia oleracea]